MWPLEQPYSHSGNIKARGFLGLAGFGAVLLAILHFARLLGIVGRPKAVPPPVSEAALDGTRPRLAPAATALGDDARGNGLKAGRRKAGARYGALGNDPGNDASPVARPTLAAAVVAPAPDSDEAAKEADTQAEMRNIAISTVGTILALVVVLVLIGRAARPEAERGASSISTR